MKSFGRGGTHIFFHIFISGKNKMSCILSFKMHKIIFFPENLKTKILSEYGQETPQSQTADKPMAPRGRANNNHETPGRQTKQSNQLCLPHQDDCTTRMDIK